MKDIKVGDDRFSAKMRRVISLFIVIITLVGGLSINKQSQAASPSSGDIIPNGTSVNWMGNLVPVGAAANGEPSCVDTVGTAGNCDDFTLNVGGTPAEWAGKRIRIHFHWQLPSTDYDMTVRRESNGVSGLQGDGVPQGTPPAARTNLDEIVGTSGNGTNTDEEVVISPSDTGVGTYYVRAIYYALNPGDQYMGTAAVFESISTLPIGTSTPLPTFDNYQPPVGYLQRDNSPEPSIGVNWNTGNVMTMSRLRANRATFDDSSSPADATKVKWFSQTSPLIRTGLDPILFTDSSTGRTIAGELVAAGGATDGFISDDDLTTATASFQTGGAVQGADHQTIAAGPPNRNLRDANGLPVRQPSGNYPNVFYYASQQIAYGAVAASFDGGVTYQTAVTAYTLAQCGGLHGHLKVAPDGTVYLPNKNCGNKAAVVVSENNGLTWSVRPIPSSSNGVSDPAVGIGAGGRVYVSYIDSAKHPRVAVSDDKGLTWRDDFDFSTGVPQNLTAAVFPATVAGDNDRAAVFFLATNSTNPGNPTGTDGEDGTAGNTADDFAGTWYPYIATTYDGGKSWNVIRADNDPLHDGVPNPVQQGVVCTNGTTCPAGTRNLADFNDLTVDRRGRILAVYADGCNFDHACININNNSATRTSNQGIARLTIIRQRGGLKLFSAFDTGGATAPRLSPSVAVVQSGPGYSLAWATPDDGGSALTSYRIYRGSILGKEQLIAEVQSDQHQFFDRLKGFVRNSPTYYKVTAVNEFGESPRDVKFSPRNKSF